MDSIEAQLEGMINRQRADVEQTHCLDELVSCNLCGKALSTQRFVIDGEVKSTPQVALPGGGAMGQWAYMCVSCFSDRGVGVGWGAGQLYERTPSNKWLLVAGFPPAEHDDA